MRWVSTWAPRMRKPRFRPAFSSRSYPLSSGSTSILYRSASTGAYRRDR